LLRRATTGLGARFEHLDAFLRHWSTATLALLLLAALFGWTLLMSATT
jgi:hypothetical protein